MTPDQPPAPRQDEQAAGGVTLTEDERHTLYLILANTHLSINDCGIVIDRLATAVERILTAHHDAAEAERAALVERVLTWIDDQRQALPEYRTPVAHGKAEVLDDLRAALAATPGKDDR